MSALLEVLSYLPSPRVEGRTTPKKLLDDDEDTTPPVPAVPPLSPQEAIPRVMQTCGLCLFVVMENPRMKAPVWVPRPRKRQPKPRREMMMKCMLEEDEYRHITNAPVDRCLRLGSDSDDGLATGSDYDSD